MAECNGIKEPAEEQDECELGLCRDCMCTMEMNPYCCDGTTYSNPCRAACAGFEDAVENEKCEKGRCGDVFICTTEYDPYCCDDKTYDNKCYAEKQGGFEDPENNKSCEQGECSGGGPSGPCTTEYEPLCCSKVTYDNECLAIDAGFEDGKDDPKCKEGKCKNYEDNKKPSICTTEYDPICCEDKYGVKITYSNPCDAETNGKIKPPAEESDMCTMGM